MLPDLRYLIVLQDPSEEISDVSFSALDRQNLS